jgi:hypothetical protein
VGEIVAAHAVVVFAMADHWLDGGPALELALDLLGNAPLLAGGVDPELVIGPGIVAAIAGIGDDALEHIADRRSMTGMTDASVCPSQGFTGQRRHVGDELAAGESPGRSRADEGAPRFFDARRNGYPISCFIIGGWRRPKPTGRPRQSGRTTPRRRAVRSSARSRFPRYSDKRGAIRLEHVPMLNTMTERMTTEVPCRRYAAHHLNLAKSSRSQSEKMLLLALAEWWLDIAERVNQGWRPHRCSAESRLDRYAL